MTVIEKLDTIKMQSASIVKLEFFYGTLDQGIDHKISLCLTAGSSSISTADISVKVFIEMILQAFILPIQAIQSRDIKWKYVSVIYPSLKNKNLLKLPLKDILGNAGGSIGIKSSVRVSLRFAGFKRSRSITIHGIVPNSCVTKTYKNDKGETIIIDNVDACEKIFTDGFSFNQDTNSKLPGEIFMKYVYETKRTKKKIIRATKTRKSSQGKRKKTITTVGKKDKVITNFVSPILAMINN